MDMEQTTVNLRELINENIVKPGNQHIKVPIERPNGSEFDGHTYLIPLEYLYYNDQNGRIGSAISEYESEHGELKPGHNEEYNQAIQEMIANSNSQKMKRLVDDIGRKGQALPGYVLNDGRVVDGNRRFTAERILAGDESVVGKQYFEAVILDNLTLNNEDDLYQIKQLELKIQFGQLEKEDYDPIDKAIDAYKTIKKKHVMTNKEYAKYADMKPIDVEKLVNEAELVVEFLRFIHANEQNYAIAKEMKLDGPLQDMLVEYKRSIKDSPDKNEILGALFTKIIQLRTDEGEDDFKAAFRPLVKNVIGKHQQDDYLEEVADSSDAVEYALQQDADGKETEVKNASEVFARIKSDEEAVAALVQTDEASTRALDKTANEKQKAEPVKLARAALDKVDAINPDIVDILPREECEKLTNILRTLEESISNIQAHAEE
ncbi:RNA polymerase subunit sigma-70 [Levilactobacillus namurensis]|uniref:RNA polymerase subunit sigma-70 n=1 Tax=Levilactobacillus namurensis TaxID=380393 RepID=UPI00222E309E|nr:RNA polymerase subunit sigma-70 [Levilactobacillus namurensis]MCW3777727.1 RNA polymerase subunit sigma-70 [Levilactobacillus namurensis]MDT7019110.1 RNA polymerase subunit sigma-70 [Levilactobacillus namurensis]WNN66284.1 RNA polymerase subunit sigma-70 [Levilactobacillus namurensis]